jgi:hypothetical protein
MAIKRTSSNSISNAVKLSTGFASAAIPNSPTIGTATAISDVAATVEYTAAVLGATGSTFTATSNPGSVTGIGSSPITVTGLTASTSYTFSVTAGNANGTSAASSASNSITTSDPLSSYESIATVTVGSGGQSTIEFTSIPSTFTHLQIRGILQGSRPGPQPSGYGTLRFNSDTGSNYRDHILGTSINNTPANLFAATEGLGNFLYLSAIPGVAAAPFFGVFITDILDYRSTNKNKVLRTVEGIDTNASTIDGYNSSAVSFKSGLWMNSASAITSITIEALGTGSPFKQYSQLALYGIKGA